LACLARFIAVSSLTFFLSVTVVPNHLVSLADNRLCAEPFAAASSNLFAVAIIRTRDVAVEKVRANSAEATARVALEVVVAYVLSLFLAHQTLFRQGARIS
jgi:hypothetical protein